ncbi:MAG: hypothetical protein AB7N76_13220 [Planctomycetota bacterium]
MVARAVAARLAVALRAVGCEHEAVLVEEAAGGEDLDALAAAVDLGAELLEDYPADAAVLGDLGDELEREGASVMFGVALTRAAASVA